MTAWESGTRVGPYELLSLAGQGGMGEVWKARDTRLGRLVAIKRTRGRHSLLFEEEARAIASLNHPHICQLYDIGPDYLVLEYVSGRAPTGPLPADRVRELALQLADALTEAHRNGIIHRDLKPSNVLITESGSLKLLDFGIAERVTPSGDDDVTRAVPSTLLGTPAYMAPEQVDGKPLDARSDIFCFGAVLYEMLSGRRAFQGGSTLQVLRAVQLEEPPPVDAPPVLQYVIRKCLAKSPDARFQTMGETTAALNATSAGGVVEDEPSIAVLPFLNLSADKDNEYFSDGLTEEILNVLARIPGLKVTARTSSFMFRGNDRDVRQIAESLKVRYILEGSVRRSGPRIRVSAQLVNLTDGYQLWSERYDREHADVFKVQDEIASAIADALQVKLSRPLAVARRHTPKLAAHEAFLKGRHHLLRITPESLARSRDYFEEALALDPSFALAHSYLAWYHFLQGFHGLRPSRTAIPLARAAARAALDLDAALPQARSMLAAITGLYDYNWPEAERLFRLALASTPVPGDVRWSYGNSYLLPFGRAEQAADELSTALEQDPLNIVFRNARGIFLYVAGKHQLGIRDARQALEIDDRYWGGYFSIGMNHASLGSYREALPAAERAYELAPWTPCTGGLLAGTLARTGDTARSQQLFAQLSDAPGQAHWGLVLYHLIAGDVEAATDWLERAIDARDLMTIIQIRAPLTAPLRASSRWPMLARRVNLPPMTDGGDTTGATTAGLPPRQSAPDGPETRSPL